MSTNDRELLEMAAKAGYGFSQPAWAAAPDGKPVVFELFGKPWNPLEDDGDALRLAVKLGFKFGFTMATGGMAHWGPVTYTDYRLQSGIHYKFNGPMETHGKDACAATRRAIVRAAAEIGRKMP